MHAAWYEGKAVIVVSVRRQRSVISATASGFPEYENPDHSFYSYHVLHSRGDIGRFRLPKCHRCFSEERLDCARVASSPLQLLFRLRDPISTPKIIL